MSNGHHATVAHFLAAPTVGGLAVAFGPDGAATRILEGVGVWLATLAIQWAFGWMKRRLGGKP